MVAAGQRCYDGNEVVQFDQTGISDLADVGGWTPIAAGSGSDATARWDIGTYKSQGLDVLGIICRPLGAGPFPVHVWNHGGSLGLSAGEVESCKNWARAGWVMAMSA